MSYPISRREQIIAIPALQPLTFPLGDMDYLYFHTVPNGVSVKLNGESESSFLQGETHQAEPGSGAIKSVTFINTTGSALTVRLVFGLGRMTVAGVATLSGALPLPSGAATDARQDTGNTTLAALNAKLPALSGGKVPVTDPTALPLPAGAATAARQDILNLAMNRGQGLLGAGSAYFEDTTAHSGSWFAITALTSAVFQGITSDIAGLPATLQLGAGQTLFGNFTSLQLTSGKVIAYAK